MSGIGGWVAAHGPNDREALERLLAAKDAETWIEDGVALGSAARRGPGALAVASDLVVAFDGALLDPATLRTFLDRRGIAPLQGSDADLVLRGWRALGSAILDRLDGSFALAVWDRRERRLALARDRAGTRSLAWARDKEGLVFAADSRRVALYIDAPIDPARIIDVLLQGHVSPPATLHRGVEHLDPGAVLTLDRDGRARTKVLFAPSFIPRSGADPDALAARLTTVVAATLERHPRPGVVLDGSIASAGMAAACEDIAAEAWSVSVEGEVDPCAAQARALGRVHHALVITEKNAPSMRMLVAEQGGPFASITPLFASAIAAEASRQHSALLWGAGAEDLAGAPAHLRHAANPLRVGTRVAPAVRRGSELLANVSLAGGREWLDRLARAAGSADTPLSHRVVNAAAVFPLEIMASVVRREWSASLFDVGRWGQSVVRKASARSPLGAAMTHGVRSHLSEVVLPAIDRATAAHGLEPAYPFLDARWIELATGLGDEARTTALARLAPFGVSEDPCATEDARLARWMSGPLQPVWREAVFSERAAIFRFVEPTKVRALLVADQAWNPHRWKQALTLWSLESWLSDEQR